MKKLRFVRTLEYYDVPQIFTCEDDNNVSFLCMLYDITNSGELNAIGVSVSKDRLSEFINGNVDLLTMFVSPESKNSIFSATCVLKKNDNTRYCVVILFDFT